MRRTREPRAGDAPAPPNAFTLAEALMAMGIVVVLAAAAIPGGMGAWNNVRQIQLNRSAEILYMTAQRNLIAAKLSGEAKADGSQTVTYASGEAAKDKVLPASTVSPALYASQWIIAYSGWTVTEVCYSEMDKSVEGQDITKWTEENWTGWKADMAEGSRGKVGWYPYST